MRYVIPNSSLEQWLAWPRLEVGHLETSHCPRVNGYLNLGHVFDLGQVEVCLTSTDIMAGLLWQCDQGVRLKQAYLEIFGSLQRSKVSTGHLQS